MGLSGNRLTIHILAAVAEHEARMISEPTKAACPLKKETGRISWPSRYQGRL
jgi:DNA invertase Pin-like site-specific DNA recombinase